MNSDQQPQTNDHHQHLVTAPLDYCVDDLTDESLPDEYDNVPLGVESTMTHLTGEER